MRSAQDALTQNDNSGAWSNGSGSGWHPDNTQSYRPYRARFPCQILASNVMDSGCGDWQSSLIDWTTSAR
jgi:hypothetical protein